MTGGLLDVAPTLGHARRMRFTKWDYLAFPVLAAVCIGVFYGALRLLGFFGIGLLGLAIGFVTVRLDLERDGHSVEPGVLVEQARARERMTRAEKAEFRAAQQWRLRPLFAAQVVATGFVILGFGLHFLL